MVEIVYKSLKTSIFFPIPSSDPGDLTVKLGVEDLDVTGQNVVNRDVIKIILHPDYNDSTNYNDIALIQLSSPVTFSDYIRPVCLAASNSVFNNGTSSWVTGWGDIQEDGRLLSSLVSLNRKKLPLT